MRTKRGLGVVLLVVAAFGIAGCSTTQEVTVANPAYTKKVTSVAYVKEDGPGADMHQNIQGAIERLPGISAKPPLPPGTRTTKEVSAFVTFIDQWRWDLAMYLRRLDVRLYDAESGDLIASGYWQDAFFHGWRDARRISEGLVEEIFSKLPGQAQPASGSAPTR